MSAPRPPSLFAGDHGRFLASITTTSFAIQVQNTAVGYQMYQLTGDPLALGMVGLAEAVPFIALALGGGLVADRVDRRTVALAALAVLATAALGLVALAQGEVVLGARGGRLAIYGLIAVGGVCRSFLQPARTALAAQLAPRELQAQAVAWRTGLFQLATVLGPALGGLIYDTFSSYAWLFVGAVLLGIGAFLAALAFTRLPQRQRMSSVARAIL